MLGTFGSYGMSSNPNGNEYFVRNWQWPPADDSSETNDLFLHIRKKFFRSLWRISSASYKPSMKTDPVIVLMAALAPDLAKSVAELIEAAAEIELLEAAAEEVDEHGNPTKAAHRARTRLRNPFLVSESTGAAS